MAKAKGSERMDKDDQMLRQRDKRNDGKELTMSSTKSLATLSEALEGRGVFNHHLELAFQRSHGYFLRLSTVNSLSIRSENPKITLTRYQTQGSPETSCCSLLTIDCNLMMAYPKRNLIPWNRIHLKTIHPTQPLHRVLNDPSQGSSTAAK